MEVKTDVFEVVRSVISKATQGKEVKLTTKLADLALGLGNNPDAYAIIGICLEIEGGLGITLTKMEEDNQERILRETETVQGLANYYRELVAARFQDDPEEECVGFYGGGGHKGREDQINKEVQLRKRLGLSFLADLGH